MFKLESYLTPWLLSYLDKYVKLKPEDFQLSLWGGDAVFNKLDLRLNVIENLTSIPIAFKSGVIHELRIHVPWTKLNNEPVVVTINTLEFVAKLKDVDASPSKQANNSYSFSNAKSPSSLSTNLNTDTTQVQQQQQQQQQSQAVPAGYIQNIINKVLFNICIIVNNVIVKFVEDDMVLSLSMKSAECYTVNERWEKAFVDVSLNNNQLKKILQLNDVTICLDRLENRRNSKINFYQDPFIYRFSVESRLNFAYASASNNALNPQLELIKMNFYCRKLDVSITDQQLPMLIRLIELISAIMDGTLDLPEATQHDETKNSSLTSLNESTTDKGSLSTGASLVPSESMPLSHVSINLEDMKDDAKQSVTSNSDESQGWLSWAWSYVPSVSLLGSEQLEQSQVDSSPTETLRIKIGLYLDELTITFKLLNQQTTNKTLSFASFLSVYAKGLCFELNQKDNISHSLFGISHIKFTSVGECCCKLCPKPKPNETLFLMAGKEDIEEKTFHYLSGSLFDADDEEEVIEAANGETQKSGESLTRKKERKFDEDLVKSRDKHGNLDEQYGFNRFGAIYFDVYSSLSVRTNEVELEGKEVDSGSEPELFSSCVLFYNLEINVSANFAHRLVKLYDCSQSHSYTRPYSSLNAMQHEAHQMDEIKWDLDTMAKKLEKSLPLMNHQFTFKDPVIKFHPFSHLLLTPIISKELNYDCHFMLTAKYIYFNMSMPRVEDERLLFEIVNKSPSVSKKLLYDAYVHKQLTVDTMRVNLTIVDNTTKAVKYDYPVLEPCYFELHFADVIMGPEVWNKQYFPMSEMVVELPLLKLNVHKQLVFILNDYLDFYVDPLLNGSMLRQMRHPKINKTQLKQAKLRHIIYKRLLEDFLPQSKAKQSEIILGVCLNDLKVKYSITKIMQIVQVNCNMLNVYLFKQEQPEHLIPLLETVNSRNDKAMKDFLIVKAQLPLTVDSGNTYIPDPLFIYANVGEMNVQVRGELLKWLNYKPTRGDDELLNLLLIEFLDSDLNEQELAERESKHKEQYHGKHESPTSSTRYKQSFATKSTISAISHSTANLKLNESTQETSYVHSTSAKPTIYDTVYDLLKSLHLQICIKSSTVTVRDLDKLSEPSDKSSGFVFILPNVNVKSSGTKCDLEEELIKAKLVELPCTYLRACEKTSNKLPWLVDLKGIQVYLTTNQVKQALMANELSVHALFNVKPKYHHHDNLLNSLSFLFNIEMRRNVELSLDKTQFGQVLSASQTVVDILHNFKYKINYEEFETSRKDSSSLIMVPKAEQHEATRNEEHWEDNKSYSSVSILKEYDLSSFEEDESEYSGATTEEFFTQSHKQQQKQYQNNSNYYEDDHCSLSTGELSSESSESMLVNEENRQKLRRKITTNLKSQSTMVHHSSHAPISHQISATHPNNSLVLSPAQQSLANKNENNNTVQLYFTFMIKLEHGTVKLVDAHSESCIRLLFHKIDTQFSLNDAYQRASFTLSRLQIDSLSWHNPSQFGKDVRETLIFTSDPTKLNKNCYFNHSKQEESNGNQGQKHFLEVTFTRALISNLNKRLNEMNNEYPTRIGRRTRKKQKKSSQSGEKWISEVNVSLNHFDFVFDLANFRVLAEFYLELEKTSRLDESPSPKSPNKPAIASHATLIPLMKASEIPLLNIDVNHVRFLFPSSSHQTTTTRTSKSDVVIAQIVALTLTSQVENPIIRNFHNNAASLSIYNKAKANGLLYRPGFVFEDRQYVMEVQNMALFMCNQDNTIQPALNHKLELIPILDSLNLKAMLALPILFGKRLINGYVFELSTSTSQMNFYLGNEELNLVQHIINQNSDLLAKYGLVNNSKKSQVDLVVSREDEILDIVPVDLLLTCQNVNFFFHLNSEPQRATKKPLFYFQLTQPHICLFMHEAMQKFELSIFDLVLKRSMLSLELSRDQLANKSDFIIPVIETKPGEPNPKTGILSGLFSLRVNNFAHLFGHHVKQTNRAEPSELAKVVCVCNECFRCFELDNKSNTGLTTQPTNSISTQMYFERPIRFKANFLFYSQLESFLNSLSVLQEDKHINKVDQVDREEQEPTSNPVQLLHDLNVHLLTSQLVFVFELESSRAAHLHAAISSLNVHMKKTTSDSAPKDFVNHVNLQLNDFQCKLSLPSTHAKAEFLHVLGPLSLKTLLSQSNAELYGTIQLGSFAVSLNRSIVQFVHDLNAFLADSFGSKQTEMAMQVNKAIKKKEKKFDMDNCYLKHEDDLRQGKLKYTVIDDNFVRQFERTQSGTKGTASGNALSHVKLPNANEILCVDDLSSLPQCKSTVTWCYVTKRALLNVKIQPLPFVGDMNEQHNVNESPNEPLKCYLEYLNECTKRFHVLKEFEIKEAAYTNVLDMPTASSDHCDLMYSRVWRIRLSKQAKRYIYASSLLASCLVDSVELVNLKRVLHMEFALSNIELKVNQVVEATKTSIVADIVTANLNELSVRLCAYEFTNECKQVSVSSFGHLAIDYCEYRFLTLNPLLDPFRFRLLTSFRAQSSIDRVRLDAECDHLNLILSQSALFALKHVDEEFKEIGSLSGSSASPLHHYLIINDTNTQLNVKQFDTDETCLIQSGECLPYIWRTHKKAQKIQIYLSKYRAQSKPFAIDQNGWQEVEFTLGSNCHMTYLINVDNGANSHLAAFSRLDTEPKFKKYVTIQSKLVLVNYSTFTLQSVLFTYLCQTRTCELNIQEEIGEMSRSRTTYELIQSNKTQLDIDLVKLNNELVIDKAKSTQSVFNQLQSGLLFTYPTANVKLWVTLYEQKFKAVVSNRNNATLPNNNEHVTQLVLAFAPLFVFCSYLPSKLEIEFLDAQRRQVNHGKLSLAPHSVTCLSTNYPSASSDSSEYNVRFDHLTTSSHAEKSASTSNELNETWFDNEFKLLHDDYNICQCHHTNRKLVFADVFKYTTAWYEQQSSRSQVKLNILTAWSGKQQSLATVSEKSALSLNLNESQSNQLVNEPKELSQFEIEKSLCWKFSRTLRVNIKPICLIVNETNLRLRLKEKVSVVDEREMEQTAGGPSTLKFKRDIGPNGGQLSLNINELATKTFKLSVQLEERRWNADTLELSTELVEYESNWIELRDEPASPFYRERQLVNCLYLSDCWIDVKLFAKTTPTTTTNRQVKLIYLVLQSSSAARNNTTSAGLTTTSQTTNNELFSTRILKIKPKFVVNNQTEHDLDIRVDHSFSLPSGIKSMLLETPIKSKSMSSICTVVNQNQTMSTTNNEETINADQERKTRDELMQSLNDLFYLNIVKSSNAPCVQSKPVILTLKEKAFKQISAQIDDNSLLSRQCFCLHVSSSNKEPLDHVGDTLALICTQKLLVVNEGTLFISLKEDHNYLVSLTNTTSEDMYIWARISTNFIMENYVRNVQALNEKQLSDELKRNAKSHKKTSLKGESSRTDPFANSYQFMHFVPARSTFKFNYDLVGTNQFPLDNLHEQVYFMFGRMESMAFELSSNMCRLYERKCEITLPSTTLHYLSHPAAALDANFNLHRFISEKCDIDPYFVHEPTPETIVQFDAHINRLTVALNDDFLSSTHQTEILRLTVTNLSLALDNHATRGSELNAKLSCEHLQLDNQMYDLDLNNMQKYDFPVLLMPREKLNKQEANGMSNPDHFRTFDAQSLCKKSTVERVKFLELNLVLVKLNDKTLRVIECDLNVDKFDLYLEDTFIYNMSTILLELIESSSNEPLNRSRVTFNMLTNELNVLAEPVLFMRRLNISKLDALVSLQTSLRIYLATYKMPIRFAELQLTGFPWIIYSSPQLVKQVTTHYLTALIFRAGWLLGSLDLIGTPTAFIQQASSGIYDFLQMPLAGLREYGPGGLVQGFSSGSLSLVRNLSAGTITSLTSFASFVSRNMDILSFDPHHLALKEQLRHQNADSFSLLQMSSSFFISIMGAIGGLAEQPLQSIHNSDSLIKGVSKGLIGLVTKPVGAVAELVNQTGQGLLRMTGVNRVPLTELRQEHRAVNKEFARYSISITKCTWKLISSNERIHVMIEAVVNEASSPSYNLAACYLALSDEILYIIDKNEDMLLRAFSISQIDVKIKSNNAEPNQSSIVITLHNQKVEMFLNESEKMSDATSSTLDRLVDYLNQTNKSQFGKSDLGDISIRLVDSTSDIVDTLKLSSNQLPDYYRFSGLHIAGHTELPCLCGSMIHLLNKAHKPAATQPPDNNKSLLSPTHSREKSMTHFRKSSEFSMNHSRQPSTSEIPRVHRMTSTSSSTHSSTMPMSTVSSTTPSHATTVSTHQQQFAYYVDPRLSANFVNVFNSLKRKMNNKGFPF